MQIVDLGEAPTVVCQMVDLREAPLMVLQDVGSRDGVGSPCKRFFFRYAQKVLVWVRHIVTIGISINYEVFPDFIESLCGDVGQEITVKWEISGKGFFIHLLYP